ncbi:AI-2E family transporter [Agrococcus jejuensis]|uniref:Predicted PurR-regulated permease PerM n=1 Tax=Agrococcus jejuensis TaxID=399736 RepID=A0A1G8DIW4_9MICO|nr:AI-2E family transporter [Agrococcus jejuensis]SDH57409.1 Predicted PurR-regulated permease PerM [Agrococcus jejuensis]
MGLFSRAPQGPVEVVPRAARAPWSLWGDSFGRLATRALQLILVVIVVAGLVFAMTQLTLVIIPVILALILASAFAPAMGWLRRKGVPSIVATILALLAIVVVLGGVVTLIVNAVRNQFGELRDQAVAGFDQVVDWVSTLPFAPTEEQITEFRDTVIDFVTSAQFGSGALAGVSAAANFLTGLVLMIVVLFFFLKDGPRIWEFLLRPFEGQSYARAQRIGDKTVGTLGGYVRGTATVAAVDAIGIGLALAILQVPLALPLAVLVFLLAFIPLVGATLAGALATLVALVANDLVTALIVLGAVILVNQLEGNFLQPVVMGRSLKLHALVILIALTVGTVLGGIVGAVLSVPIAAVAWGIIQVWDGPDTPARMFRQKRPEVA